jgi:hypothetical protein
MMQVRKTYIFFLVFTMVGAFATLKICSAAYSAFDYSDINSDTGPVIHHHHSAPQPPADATPTN